jgi:hypothetical protein
MHAMTPRAQLWIRGLGLLIALATLAAVPVRPVAACSCAMPGGPDAEFSKAAAVFTGTVSGLGQRSGFNLLDRIRFYFGFAPQIMGMDSVRATLDVASSWKGVTTTPVTVVTGFGGGDCGFGFSQGQQYLVYAYHNGPALGTNMCWRSGEISQVATDLAYLQTQPTLVVTQSANPALSLWLLAGAALLLGLLVMAGGGAWVWRHRAASRA